MALIIGVSADVWAAVGSLGTLLVATLVYAEARSIRKTEWILRQNQTWNDVNRSIVEHCKDCRIAELVTGEIVEVPLTAQESFLLMCFFNAVSNEYNSLKAKTIFQSYVLDSFTETAVVVRQNPWILAFLRTHGYEAAFIRMLGVIAVGTDRIERQKLVRRELLASATLSRLLGDRFQAWVRRGFAFTPKEGQVLEAKLDGSEPPEGVRSDRTPA